MLHPRRTLQEMDWHSHSIFKQVTEGIFRFDPNSPWDGISDEAKDLVSSLLRVDVARRLDVDGAIAHPWMQMVTRPPFLHATCTFLTCSAVCFLVHRTISKP